MNSQVWWFTARAGGIIGWAILAAATIWGLALSTKVTKRHGPRPNWMLDLHRYLGGLGLIFTIVHVAAIVADSYVHFGLVNVLVPFTGDTSPIAVGWGIIAAYLLVAVEITSLARKRLPKRLWRLTHFASFPLFGLATVHGLTAGTDSTSPALVVAMAASVAVITGLTALRIYQSVQPAPPRPNAVPGRRLVSPPATDVAPTPATAPAPAAAAVRVTSAGGRSVAPSRANARPIPYAPAGGYFVPAPTRPETAPSTPFDWDTAHLDQPSPIHEQAGAS